LCSLEEEVEEVIFILQKKDKPKPISYKTIKSNKTLEKFFGVHEEDEEEAKSV
jgi:hypothetical protein